MCYSSPTNNYACACSRTQVLFTHDKLSLLSLGGAMLVTSSILIIVFFKQSGAESGSGSVELSQMRSAIHDIKDSLSMDEEWEEATDSPSSTTPSTIKGTTMARTATAGKKGFNYAALRASVDSYDLEEGERGGLDVSAHGEPDLPVHSSGAGNTGSGYSTLSQVES
jgi:hypothetical protein